MKKDESNINIKVVFLGEAGVGKTCVVQRLVHNTFKETITTTGGSYSQRVFFFESFNRSIKFNIWDTAGSERFRTLNKIFYKDAQAAVLVYDITNKESYKEIENYWLNQLKENGDPKISKLL